MVMRSVSSKNDVFLSIVDLLTLLLFSFLALAFRVSHGRSAQSILDLPVMPTGVQLDDRAQPPAEVIFVSWSGEEAAAGKGGQTCIVEVRERDATAPADTTQIPCVPGAFRGGQTVALSQRLLAAAESGFSAVALCPVDTTTLEACARLQWVVAEHGFRSTVAVQNKGGR